MKESDLEERIRTLTRSAPKGKLRVFRDTSQFMNISAGHVLQLSDRFYLVRGDEVEGRFGIDEQPKFWVKKALDLQDGSSKIVKLVFYESFTMHLGDLAVECFRSPRKEGRILEKVRRDPSFMHGITVEDDAGNTVRIVDKILGPCLYNFIHRLDMDHRTYFFTRFPPIFDRLVEAAEGIGRLHDAGEVHGDIRNDHLLIDREHGDYRWIDFDYTYEWAENRFGVDLFGLGNVLLFVMGKGFHTLKDATLSSGASLVPADMSLFFQHRVINLRKLFPYIPQSFQWVLMHFGREAELFYENTGELLADLETCRSDLAYLL